MSESNISAKRALVVQLWQDNPIFRQVLGICSSLAVTNLMFNTLLMCVGLIWSTALSSLTFSALRAYIPARIRMIVEVMIICVYVIVVDVAIHAYYPDIHRVIGPYVGLIITNCIIMGRMEAYAIKNRPWPSFCDGIGSGLGYSAILMLVALIREVMGFGTVFGFALPATNVWWHSWTIMIMPPGAFFVLAMMVWAARSYAMKLDAAKLAAGGKPK
jgi:Na+-transporting NADH:ubiquinone oxidoreductase subunit D